MEKKRIDIAGGMYIDTVCQVDHLGVPVSSGGVAEAVTIGDGSNSTLGAKADTRATWYDTTVSHMAMLKLLVAATVGAGSHAYGYNASNQLTTDAWTLFGTTRTKTYTYNTSGNGTGLIATETDWV